MVSVIDIGEIFLAYAVAGSQCQTCWEYLAQPGASFSLGDRLGEAGDRCPFVP